MIENDPYLKLKIGDSFVDAYQYVPGKGHIKFFVENGVIPPHAILETTFSKKYSAYQLIKKDLDFVGLAINSLKEMRTDKDHDVIRQSLSTSISITYGKCFTEALGRGTTLNKGVFRKADEDLIKLHYEIMQGRHNYYAHSGKTQFERNPIVLVVMQDSFRVHSNIIYMLSIRFNFEIIDRLISFLTAYVDRKIDLFFDKMINELLDSDLSDYLKYTIVPSKMRTIEELHFDNQNTS